MANNIKKYEEIYEDVPDFIPSGEQSTSLELGDTMVEAQLAVSYFFNNRFLDAMKLMKACADRSIYHALGYGSLTFLQAIMTFDPKDIESAIEVQKKCIEVCNRQRRKVTISESIGKIMKQSDYNLYTEEEIHAELCYGECLLARAILTFLEDETLMSFIKGSMKIRSCFQSYRECWNILQHRNHSEDHQTVHFESGVRMGVGTFNLMMSQLPTKIIKLLEFVGFSTNKHFGLEQLEMGFALDGSLRQGLCVLTLLGFHLFATYAIGTAEGDVETSERILDNQLKLYPQGALFLFFKARLHLVKGDFSTAAVLYNESRLCQTEWKQFQHLCYWELYWCAILKGHYKEAEICANILLLESKWSKAIYAYLKACCLIHRKHELTQKELRELKCIMRSVPELRQKIAGKSLPVEKFAAKKSTRYFAQNESLTLPCLEMLYAWNLHKVLAKSKEDIQRVYLLAEEEQNKLINLDNNERNEYYWDNMLLVHLIKGCCLSNMESPLQAIECLNFIIDNEKKTYEDKFLIPYAILEIALIHVRERDLINAKQLLEHARNDYKGYLLESRLHFRIHSTLNRIKSLQKQPKKHENIKNQEIFFDVPENCNFIENTL